MYSVADTRREEMEPKMFKLSIVIAIGKTHAMYGDLESLTAEITANTSNKILLRAAVKAFNEQLKLG